MKKPRGNIVRVSDHALLRFLERAGGCDVEALRTSIEGSLKRAVSAAAEIGTGDLIVNADGLQYIICDGVVVTVSANPTLSRVVRKT
ncbi:MAG: hypothetical protein ACRC9K_12300 [Afipia sp.]